MSMYTLFIHNVFDERCGLHGTAHKFVYLDRSYTKFIYYWARVSLQKFDTKIMFPK